MKQKGTVLIFAYECYPYHRRGSAIGAQRPYQFAKNLSLLGWKVIVLCCDQSRRRTLKRREAEHTIKEIYTAHADALKKEDYTIIPLPSLDYNGWGDYAWSKMVSEGPGGTYIGKPFPFSWIRIFFTICNQLFRGDYSWSWNPVATGVAEQIIKNSKIDVMIGEHGPDAGIILADALSRKHHIPWVADFRDPVLWPFKGLFKMVYKQKVKRIVDSSSATINVNSYWTALDKKHFAKEAYTVVNGYDHEAFEKVPARSFQTFVVSYFGSFSQKHQDIKPSLKAFSSLLQKLHYPLDVQLFYRGLSDREFLAQCRESGIPEAHLDIKGFIEKDDAVAAMKGSAVLLIYSFPPYKVRNVYEKKGFYPGKIFEYVGAGTPVLLIPSDEGLLASFIHDHQKGLACTSIEEAVSFLEEEYWKWKNDKQLKVSLPTDKVLYSRYAQAVQLDKILSSHLHVR